MGEENINTCRVVALKYPPITRNIDCIGPNIYQCDEGNQYTSNVNSSSKSEKQEVEKIYEDNVEYLRSLDPKEWKDQDHYEVLGLGKLRYKATEDDIKKAYRQKVLKHHPDKRVAKEDVRPDDDYFTCITKAYEILGTPVKRRSYDSVDPLFDDSLPTNADLKKDFYEVASKYFELNSRWSEKKNVPKLGNSETGREDVEKFYSFWYNFESWREFSYLDEEEKEKGQDREERRWIEKQNKVARSKRKKEEMARVRNLVDLAYSADPRIVKFKQEDKERKLALKRAKLDAVQAKKEEEERMQREAQLAKEKAEADEKARIEAIRQEREVQKKALKKERKAFRDVCKANNYFSSDPDEGVTHMTAVEKICEMLKLTELEDINKKLTVNGKQVFLEIMKEVDERIDAERKAMIEQPKVNSVNAVLKSGTPEWNSENVHLLIKAVNLFPAGTNQRWEVVANFINQHGDTTNGRYSAKDVLAKAKDLQKTDFSKNNLKNDVNRDAFNNFEKNKKNAKSVEGIAISEKEDEPMTNGVNHNSTEKTNNVSNSKANTDIKKNDSLPWTPEEQQLLEQALKTYPASTNERWDRISECIPNRSKKDCMRRYKELVDLVKAKKAAQAAVK